MPDSSSRRAFAERTGECGAVCSPHPRRARPQVTVATRDRARWAAVTSRATHNSIPRAVLPGSRQHARRIASKADVADQREDACRHGAPEEREPQCGVAFVSLRSEEHTSELQSLMRISYAVFCLKTKKTTTRKIRTKND